MKTKPDCAKTVRTNQGNHEKEARAGAVLLHTTKSLPQCEMKA